MNITDDALAKKIVNHIISDLVAMQDLGDLKFNITPDQLKGTCLAWITQIKHILKDTTDIKAYNAWFDGSAKPNPGIMKIGGYIENPDGLRIHEFSEELGEGTNNEAEYLALFRLATEIVKKGILRVNIKGDSQLVVNQVNNKWKVKEPRMGTYKNQICKMFNDNNVLFKLMQIPRNENKGADLLTR